ncbi:MAG: alpha-L-rhamnosidase C-terminal domain-containing protein [Actinomycetota bacterium]
MGTSDVPERAVDASRSGALLTRNVPSFPSGPWRARWIWAADAPADTRHVVALGLRFELAAVPQEAPMRWCAVSRAVVSVNGVEVGHGPVRANPRRQPYEHGDLAPALRVGANELVVLAMHYAGPTPWYLPMPALASDLAGGAFVFEADLGDRWLLTDETWSAQRLEGWGASARHGISGRGTELIDLRSLGDPIPSGPAIVRRAHAVGESGRPTPPSYPLGPFAPSAISDARSVPIAFDNVETGVWTTERIVAGTLRLDVEGAPGASVTARVTEAVDEHDQPVIGPEDAEAQVVCDGTRRRVESLDRYGGRGVVVTSDPGVLVHGVEIIERLYPVSGGARFASSDPLLDRIYEVGRRSVSLNSTDAYTDCPTREQRAWTGDAVVHQMVDLTTNDDWLLARRNVALIGESRRPDGMLPMAVGGDAEAVDFTIIPDWALHWIHAVWNLYRYVGDREEIAAHLVVAEGVLAWFDAFVDDRGLLRDVVGWVIIDWSAVSTDGACAALNGLYGRALREFAEMAGWLGDGGRVAWARLRHERLRSGFEALWDPLRQRYIDSIVGADVGAEGERQTASEHAQAAAIVGGLVPDERLARLVDVLEQPEGRVWATFSEPSGPAPPNSEIAVGGAYLRTGTPEPWWDVEGLVVAQPFFSYVVHDALVAAGRGDLIVNRCRRWDVALERCATSWTETWFGGTYSHGWSSTPTRDLVQRVLGVTPAEPGFGTAAVEPRLGDLAWAEGTVPTPHGPIEVRAEPGELAVHSPIPIVVAGTPYAAGRHSIRIGPTSDRPSERNDDD